MRLTPIVLALALTGCATDPAITAGQTLTASWQSLGKVSPIIDNLANSHALHGANAARASQDLKAVVVYLNAATDAYQKGDLTTTEGQVSAAAGLLAELLTLSNNPNAVMP